MGPSHSASVSDTPPEIGVGVEFLGPVELRDDDLQLRCALPPHQGDVQACNLLFACFPFLPKPDMVDPERPQARRVQAGADSLGVKSLVDGSRTPEITDNERLDPSSLFLA